MTIGEAIRLLRHLQPDGRAPTVCTFAKAIGITREDLELLERDQLPLAPEVGLWILQQIATRPRDAALVRIAQATMLGFLADRHLH